MTNYQWRLKTKGKNEQIKKNKIKLKIKRTISIIELYDNQYHKKAI